MIGAILLVLALGLMLSCLVCIVKLLHGLLKGKIAIIVKNVINANFPGKLSYFTGYLAILVGAGITMIIQSSSIFTSSLTPLVGLGIVSIERMYPLTIGANVGTTFTGILAALSQSSKYIDKAIQVALCHLLFNISGILIWYPLPFMRLPVKLAKLLGMKVEEYRWFALVYLIFTFFIFPASVFGLSMLAWYAAAAVWIPIAVIICLVLIISLIQRKKATLLPRYLRTWKFLPEPMRSLAPIDRAIEKAKFAIGNITKRKCNNQNIINKSDVTTKF